MQISHSLTRSRRTSGPNSTVRRSIVSEEARPPRSLLGSKSLTLLRLFSLWQIFYTPLEVLPDLRHAGVLTWGLDEEMSICSSNPQDHGGNTNSSWLESDLKVRKCHAMLFFESLYEPKTDRLDHRCWRKFHGKGGKLKTFHRHYVRVLKGGRGGGGGVPVPFPSPFFSRNPISQCSNPIPTITASKCDPTKTQKFTRIYKDVLKITGSFQTVIKLSSSEFIAISPCHFTFLPFLPAGNLPSDL